MTDKAKTINIINHSLQIQKFHGHMKLELTGMREKLVVEHDNNMTDALEKLFDNKGIWMNPYTLINDMCPTVEKALGGILLTDKLIPDGNLYVPAGTEVTACAAYNIANNDDALTMGSYNQQESALDAANKKMTYVYDWTTNQGNGTIAAACLTHVNAGHAAYGDANISSITNTGNLNIVYANGTSINCVENPIYIDDEYIYTAVLKNSRVTIRKMMNCMKSVEAISVIFGQSNWMEYKTIQIWEFQCDGLNSLSIKSNVGTSVYICNSDTINPENTLKIHRFNFTDTDVIYDVVNIRNTATQGLYTGDGIVIANGYFYAKSSSRIQLIEIKLDNNSDTNEYQINRDILLKGTKNLNNKLFMGTGQIYNVYSGCVFDTVTKTMKLTKCGINRTGYECIGDTWNRITSSNNVAYLEKMLNYLATINNLEKSVTKTADKTMKVTYTIQG